MSRQIEYISTDKLYPHPQNPRKTIDDVTELADSIKQKGILQNLTVVRGGAGVPDGADGYTVIIGHRRLTAAKQAGVKEVPCVIAEMTESEQQETMLLENMQRTDLTVVEQAQGFQLLFDMGHSQKEISEKTGFSPATISRRLKIAKLDLKKSAEAEERGGTLEDFVRLTEIKDEKQRAKLLDQIGTSNFEWSLKEAQRKQHIAEKEPPILEELKSIANPLIGNQWDIYHYSVLSIYNVDDYVPGMFKEKIEDGKEYQYQAVNGYYVLYEFDESAKTNKFVAPKKSKTEIRADRRRKDLSDLTERAYEMRKSFVENFTAFKTHESKIADFLAAGIVVSVLNYLTKNNLEEALNIAEDNKNIVGEFNNKYESDPLKLQFMLAYMGFYDEKSNGYFAGNWGEKMPNWRENQELDLLYKNLIALGYEMSDEERKLMNGEHELF